MRTKESGVYVIIFLANNIVEKGSSIISPKWFVLMKLIGNIWNLLDMSSIRAGAID
jgi:hypothetical protein